MRALSLAEAIKRHRALEQVSLHTPGHKARSTECSLLPPELSFSEADVTELPGLDDLSFPTGVIHSINQQLSRIWNSCHSYLSLNGASAALMAAVIATSTPGKRILIPRNVHRSVINALVLTGAEPLWYDAHWNSEWGVWSGADYASFANRLKSHKGQITSAVVNSVEYSGAVTNLEPFDLICMHPWIALIADEAHGAHRIEGGASGASFVVHSLHKTMGALTQTGVLHSFIAGPFQDRLQSALSLLHSSSPSYALMASIEQATCNLPALHRKIGQALEFASELRQWLIKEGACVFSPPAEQDRLHILFRFENRDTIEFNSALVQSGVYTETILGRGILLMPGIGTTEEDITKTKEAIKKAISTTRYISDKQEPVEAPYAGEQVLSPRDAWFRPSQTIAISEASGRIASECLAPCPPGTPVVCPGQRVPDDISTLLPEHRWLRVVIES